MSLIDFKLKQTYGSQPSYSLDAKLMLLGVSKEKTEQAIADLKADKDPIVAIETMNPHDVIEQLLRQGVTAIEMG